MKLLVAVLSKNRYRENQILRNTWSWLKYSKFDKKVFVEPQDYEKYVEALGAENVVSVEKDNINMGGSKAYIQDWALKNGYDLVLKCDDDIWSWRDFKNGWYPYQGKTGGVPMEERKRACAEYIFDRTMEDSIELFDTYKEVGGVMYMYGQMMFHTPGVKWLNFNARLATVYMCRADLLAPPFSSQIHQFEDFYTWYEMRKKGYFAPKYGLSGINIDGNYGVNSGGLQDFNRIKLTFETIKLFTKLYPGEIHWKRDNGSGGFFVTTDTRKIELCKPVSLPTNFTLNK